VGVNHLFSSVVCGVALGAAPHQRRSETEEQKMKQLISLVVFFACCVCCAQPQDLHTTITPIWGAAPSVVTNNTAKTTTVIDCNEYQALEFYVMTGNLEDSNATFAVTLTYSDTVTSPTNTHISGSSVPASSLIGTTTAASFTYANDNVVKQIGYIKTKRYVSLTVTPSGNTGNAPLCILAVGRPLIRKAR